MSGGAAAGADGSARDSPTGVAGASAARTRSAARAALDARVVVLGVNVPAPVAGARLAALGAAVVKVEPPAGDPLEAAAPEWYRELVARQRVVRLDLKAAPDRARLDELLHDADVLFTAQRPAALGRLGLAPEQLRRDFPRLCSVAIVGHPAPHGDVPGHDLTYMAEHGLLELGRVPRTLLADLGGAERAATAALALLLGRARPGAPRHAEVPLSEAAEAFAAPWRHGITRDGVLSGAFPGYRLYRALDGWIALAALEPHFWARTLTELGIDDPSHGALERSFAERTAGDWVRWARERDLPLAHVVDDAGDDAAAAVGDAGGAAVAGEDAAAAVGARAAGS